MQNIRNASAIKRLKTILFTYRLLYQNMVIADKNLQQTKKKGNPNTTLKIVIKSEDNKRGREGKDLQKQSLNNPQNGNKDIHINNYFKYKLIKCPNQKIDWMNEYKNRTHKQAVYKRPTSDLETLTD